MPRKKTASKKNAVSGSSTKKPAVRGEKSSKAKLSTISRAMAKKSGTKKRKTKSVSARQSKKAVRGSQQKTLKASDLTALTVKKNGYGSNLTATTANRLQDLPFSYNETKMVLLARDPFWAYSYWDFSADTWNWIQELRHKKNGLRYVLRIKNLKDHTHFDIEIQLETKNWYIHIGIPDVSFEGELGVIDSSGKYYLIVRSNKVQMPRNGPSDEIDSRWNPEYFDEIYQLSGGGKTGRSSDISSHFRRRTS